MDQLSGTFLVEPGAAGPVDVSPQLMAGDRDYIREVLEGGNYDSASGTRVSAFDAFRVPAFWNAVDLISGDVSRLPLQVIERLDEKNTRVAVENPTHQLCAVQPNPWQSPVEFWCMLLVQLLVYGECYAAIGRKQNGQVGYLLPLLSAYTNPTWQNGETKIVTEIPYDTNHNLLVTYNASEVLRIRGMVFQDLDRSLVLVQHARDTLGLALAAQGYASQFYRSGGRKGGVLEVPRGTPKEVRDTIEEGFAKVYHDIAAAFRTVILREGSKFHESQFNPKDAQMIESREFETSEIARFFKLHPSKLGLDTPTYTGTVAEKNKDYLDHTLSSWLSKICGEVNIKLLAGNYRSGRYYAKHDTSDLLWLAPAEQATVLETLIRARVINPNEGRAKLGLPQGPPELDLYVNPATTSFSGRASEPEDEQLSGALRQLFLSSAQEAGRKFRDRASRSASSPSRYIDWIDNQAEKDIQQLVTSMQPVAEVIRHAISMDVMEPMRSMFNDQLQSYRQLAEETAAESLKSDVQRLSDQVDDQLGRQVREIL